MSPSRSITNALLDCQNWLSSFRAGTEEAFMTRWDGVMVGREALSVEAGILEVAY